MTASNGKGRRPRIALFSGGSACRSINIALARRPLDLTRIVPAWDSGGSSKIIREAFGILPVGDIRQALMTMAHGEGRVGEVVKICNARLSTGIARAGIRAEFDYYAEGRHPLLQRMPAALRSAILDYLSLFKARIDAAPGDGFDLSNGSIGNFILTGAYLAHGHDINEAVRAFRRLCRIHGHVWPAATDDAVQLNARLKDGRWIEGQHRITALGEADGVKGIADIALAVGTRAKVAANPAALEAVAAADLIVFGPGSFYSSILPHLLVEGVADAVAANAAAPRVFIGNILECAETRGVSLADLVGTFLATWQAAGAAAPALTHVLANRDLFPFEKRVGAFRYLRAGAIEPRCERAGIRLERGDFEDAWVRGQHDGEVVAAELAALASAGAAARRPHAPA